MSSRCSQDLSMISSRCPPNALKISTRLPPYLFFKWSFFLLVRDYYVISQLHNDLLSLKRDEGSLSNNQKQNLIYIITNKYILNIKVIRFMVIIMNIWQNNKKINIYFCMLVSIIYSLDILESKSNNCTQRYPLKVPKCSQIHIHVPKMSPRKSQRHL